MPFTTEPSPQSHTEIGVDRPSPQLLRTLGPSPSGFDEKDAIGICCRAHVTILIDFRIFFSCLLIPSPKGFTFRDVPILFLFSGLAVCRVGRRVWEFLPVGSVEVLLTFLKCLSSLGRRDSGSGAGGLPTPGVSLDLCLSGQASSRSSVSRGWKECLRLPDKGKCCLDCSFLTKIPLDTQGSERT